MSISDNLKALRKKHGLSQKELAEAMGISDRTISTWENDNSAPSIKDLVKLVELYDIDLDDFLCVTRKTPDKTKEERNEEFIAQFRALSPKRQRALLMTLDWPEDISD